MICLREMALVAKKTQLQCRVRPQGVESAQ
jgi:hypothetical protein